MQYGTGYSSDTRKGRVVGKRKTFRAGAGSVTIDHVEQHFTAVSSAEEFNAMAACVIDYQITHCSVYRKFAESHLYLPVSAFRHVPITSFPTEEAERVFVSSGTGQGQPRSRHWIRRLSVYERSVITCFERIAGTGPYTILVHLPEYAKESSLVYMARLLIERMGDEHSNFFLHDYSLLDDAVDRCRPVILLGAAFGLLELIDGRRWILPDDSLIIETGGMKTYRRHMVRSELHACLSEGFGLAVGQVWSEYGMCELSSQAYACGGEVFYPAPWLRCSVRDPSSLLRVKQGTPGVLAVVDLANMYSVSCLLTEDLAVQCGGGFEVLGRLPQSALRGCNFLLEDALT